MIGRKISTRAVHTAPADVRKMLASSPKAVATWKDITVLARNEWVCWVTSAKKKETRVHRIERMRSELTAGKRRPCCFAGCSHR